MTRKIRLNAHRFFFLNIYIFEIMCIFIDDIDLNQPANANLLNLIFYSSSPQCLGTIQDIRRVCLLPVIFLLHFFFLLHHNVVNFYAHIKRCFSLLAFITDAYFLYRVLQFILLREFNDRFVWEMRQILCNVCI